MSSAPHLANASQASAAQLRDLPFFLSFQNSWLESLAKLSSTTIVQPGQWLLKQGESNSKLFFLVAGKIEVQVDSEPVAVLENKGDLFGEMSVISSQPVAASLIAIAPSEIIWIEAKELAKTSDFPIHEIQHLLFRMYSQILTAKLKQTNQKAKFFERTNKELERARTDLEVLNKDLEKKVAERTADLEQKRLDLIKINQKLETQNTELMIGHRKFEQLYLDRDVTFKKMEVLYRDHLLPLQFTFDFLQHHTNPATQEALKHASLEVQDIVNLLEPLNALLSMERAAKTRRVLFAEPNKKQQIVARLALGGTGVTLDMASSEAEAKALFDQHLFDIVFVHPDLLPVAKMAKDLNPLVQIVLMTSEQVMDLVPKIKALNFSVNMVSRSEEDKIFSIKNISTTITKLAAQDIFGLEKYLSWGVDVQTRNVRASKDRAQLASDVDQYMASLGVRKTVRDRALLVLEEMLMNAIFDAPTDADGKSLFNHQARTIPVELKPFQEGTLSFASDGMLLAVSVSDPFGSLSGDVILRYLETCYSGAAGTLNTEKGGAGRGLHQIIENADLVVFNIRPRFQTEVIALFNVDPKESRVNFPSFHLFIGK